MCCDVDMSFTSVTATLDTRDCKVVGVVTGKQGRQAKVRNSDYTTETQAEMFDTLGWVWGETTETSLPDRVVRRFRMD